MTILAQASVDLTSNSDLSQNGKLVRLFVCLLACLLVCLLACLLVCLLACLLVCLFVCLFVDVDLVSALCVCMSTSA